MTMKKRSSFFDRNVVKKFKTCILLKTLLKCKERGRKGPIMENCGGLNRNFT